MLPSFQFDISNIKQLVGKLIARSAPHPLPAFCYVLLIAIPPCFSAINNP